MATQRVRFQCSHSIYNAGEIAGFPEATARQLITSGIVVPVVTEVQPPITEEPDAPEDELSYLDTGTKDDTEDEMKRKAMRRPPRDRMMRGSQTK